MRFRKPLSFMLALVMVVSLTLAFTSDLARAENNTYTVRYGDNLTSIAAQLGVSVQALAQTNGIVNVNNIYVGQVLKLPVNGKPLPAPVTTGDTAYLVQPGDTLSGIAAHFEVGIYDLAALNHLSVMSYVYIGQTLRIPQIAQAAPTPKPLPATAIPTPTLAPTPTMLAPTPTPLDTATVPPTTVAASSSYTVQHGDTLSSIATRFNVTVEAIVQANHISDPSLIFGGQILIIPGGDTSVTTATVEPGSVAPTATPNPQLGVIVPPATLAAQGKWIDVDLSKQKLVAYEGTTPVYSSLVSTGVSYHPTVVGTFNIYVKYTSQAMSGGTRGVDYYYLPNVPYVMYFYAAYALHGTYWHHNFGHPMSHGCVNLPTPASQWLFNWAPIGTPVRVHY